MSATPAALADAAQGLVGTRFRLQGRDPETGLDCLGLVACALQKAGSEIALPANYRPTRRRFEVPDHLLHSANLEAASAPIMRGDVLMTRTGRLQAHAAIATGPDRIVHAHAGLRRVVEGPWPLNWPILGHWRLAHRGDS